MGKFVLLVHDTSKNDLLKIMECNWYEYRYLHKRVQDMQQSKFYLFFPKIPKY